MIVLQTARLRAEICEPGEDRNRTVRFDRAGFVSRVTLDGVHEFCSTEPDNLSHPCSGGAGLCSEIKTDIWQETPVGSQCPKFGVGLITKPSNEKYQFHDLSYAVEHFDISWEASDTQAVFHTEPKSCMGYSLRQTKVITLDDSSINVRYVYENVGEKPLKLSEYVHNFVTLDKLPIGPDYYLAFPTASSQQGKRPKNADSATIYGKGHGFTFSAYNARAASIGLDNAEIDPGERFRWTLTHSNCVASMSEVDSFIPDRVPIWTIDHIISPEVFHDFSVMPGESHEYTREWIFRD